MREGTGREGVATCRRLSRRRSLLNSKATRIFVNVGHLKQGTDPEFLNFWSSMLHILFTDKTLKPIIFL